MSKDIIVIITVSSNLLNLLKQLARGAGVTEAISSRAYACPALDAHGRGPRSRPFYRRGDPARREVTAIQSCNRHAGPRRKGEGYRRRCVADPRSGRRRCPATLTIMRNHGTGCNRSSISPRRQISRHLTKGSVGKNPLERLNGSGAFGALPRVVMGAAKNEAEATASRSESWCASRATSGRAAAVLAIISTRRPCSNNRVLKPRTSFRSTRLKDRARVAERGRGRDGEGFKV